MPRQAARGQPERGHDRRGAVEGRGGDRSDSGPLQPETALERAGHARGVAGLDGVRRGVFQRGLPRGRRDGAARAHAPGHRAGRGRRHRARAHGHGHPGHRQAADSHTHTAADSHTHTGASSRSVCLCPSQSRPASLGKSAYGQAASQTSPPPPSRTQLASTRRHASHRQAAPQPASTRRHASHRQAAPTGKRPTPRHRHADPARGAGNVVQI